MEIYVIPPDKEQTEKTNIELEVQTAQKQETYTKEEVDEMLKFFGKLQKEKQVIKHNKHDDIYVGYDF